MGLRALCQVTLYTMQVPSQFLQPFHGVRWDRVRAMRSRGRAARPRCRATARAGGRSAARARPSRPRPSSSRRPRSPTRSAITVKREEGRTSAMCTPRRGFDRRDDVPLRAARTRTARRAVVHRKWQIASQLSDDSISCARHKAAVALGALPLWLRHVRPMVAALVGVTMAECPSPPTATADRALGERPSPWRSDSSL